MKTHVPRSIWLVLVAVLALVGAGCGGGESRLSEDDFVDEFDDVCNDVSAELDDLGTPDDNEELAEQAGEAVDIASQGVEDLRDINPPEDLQDEVDDLLGVLEDRVELFEELEAAAEDDDDDEIVDLAEQNAELEEEVDELGDDIGIDCFVDEDDDASDDLSDSSDDFSDDFSDDLSDDATDDFSDDLSDDFSDDFSDDVGDLGEGVPPEDFIAEYGANAEFDGLANDCYFDANFQACDDLYRQTPVSDDINSYEGYGATCGGRLPDERPGQCVTLGGG